MLISNRDKGSEDLSKPKNNLLEESDLLED